MGVTELFLSYKCLKLKLRVFLAGHIVAMITFCATKLTATCSPMIGGCWYHDFGVNRYRMVIITHQTLSLEKYWKLLPATLQGPYDNRTFMQSWVNPV